MTIERTNGTVLRLFEQFGGQKRDSAFPFTADVYGGPGIQDTTNRTWSYDAAGMRDLLSGATVDETGMLRVPSQTIQVSIGLLKIPISNATFVGALNASRDIIGIHGAHLEGCITQAALDAALATMDMSIADIVRRESVADCDSIGNGSIDAYRVIIDSQPVTVATP